MKHYFTILLTLTSLNSLAQNNFQDLCNRAMDLFYCHNYKEAADLYRQALNIKPNQQHILFNLGYICATQGDSESAIHYYQQALTLQPDYAKAHLFLAQELNKKNKIQQAKHHYKQAIEYNHTCVQAYSELAALYIAQKNWQAALHPLQKLSELHKEDTNILFQQAYILTKLFQFDHAIPLYKSLLEQKPNDIASNYNLAHSLQRSGKMLEAIPYYEKTIELNRHHKSAHFGLAKASLALGDFTRGWQEFEWRMFNQEEYRKHYQIETLTPEQFKNKTIVIRSEWGLGDTIHFIRYAWEVKKSGAKKIIVQTFSPLIPLFSLCFFIDQVISTDTALPKHDMQIPLLSLPLIFKTEPETIPADIPYLQADTQLVTHWEKKLQKSASGKIKIGLCWQAAPETFLEDNPLTKRSVPLSIFALLADFKDVEFYSLQKQSGIDQLNNLPKGFNVHDFGPNLDTINGRFMDTAAIIHNLDLIITVDTSIAHLAGSLGTPVWIILPSVAEWRWRIKKRKTDWYPTAHLFRQQKHGDWESVIKKIKNKLISLGVK